MVTKLPTLTNKIAIQLHLVAESCTICSSRSRRPVRKLSDSPSYLGYYPMTRRSSVNVAPSSEQGRLARVRGSKLYWDTVMDLFIFAMSPYTQRVIYRWCHKGSGYFLEWWRRYWRQLSEEPTYKHFCGIYEGVSKIFRTERQHSSLPLVAVVSIFCESV
jgi:hypothetical protein